MDTGASRRRPATRQGSNRSSWLVIFAFAVMIVASMPVILLLNDKALTDTTAGMTSFMHHYHSLVGDKVKESDVDNDVPEKKEKTKKGLVEDAKKSDTKKTSNSDKCALEAFDLSTNHLQRIELAGAGLAIAGPEDFLPIVSSGKPPDLRFRLRGNEGATPAAIENISAYQIQSEHAHSDKVLWDSGKTTVKKTPRSIEWGGDALKAGTVVKWRVLLWDGAGEGPCVSDWTKFGVGPEAEWTAKWISHENDVKQLDGFPHKFERHQDEERCNRWKARRPLPVARAKVELSQDESSKTITSALLVVSGLGSFLASMDGQALSSSSVLDPALTDYTQRVTYRGFDVTKYFTDDKSASHVVGIALGTSWWDTRPIQSSIVKFHLLPRGPLTAVAQLHLTFSDGTSVVKIPTGGNDWQVAKGFLRDSDLFTGDTTDLGTLEEMKDWDSPKGWSTGTSNGVVWTEPVLYKNDTTVEGWRKTLTDKANGRMNEAEASKFSIVPVGKLYPPEAPPVMPIERIAPESVVSLGDGRWLFDFGKAMSGVVRFENGLPSPIKPKNGYPRAHTVDTREGVEEDFVTVIYGESLVPETGEINQFLVAGSGLHRDTAEEAISGGGPCYPKDHGAVLSQRDVYIAPKSSSFASARQSRFSSHAFRFAEVCCTEEPPKDVHALLYRTAFPEWGKFDSSAVKLNGAYELTRNALVSNMLGTQTDCPHREKLQYGGDLNADSPAALHFFDISGFYRKIIHDWIDTQWDQGAGNGAYTETSTWQNLNEYAAIGHGAGETAWASAPPVLTVRHSQHYGDLKFMKETFDYHAKWLKFVNANWWSGMEKLSFQGIKDNFKNFESYTGNSGGLGDWLSIHTRDVWLTHHAFYMASARSLAYLAKKLGAKAGDEISAVGDAAMATADEIKKNLTITYMTKDPNKFTVGPDNTPWSTQADLALLSRIVPGEKRCSVLKEWLRFAGSGKELQWTGQDEKSFFQKLNKADLDKLVESKKVQKFGKGVYRYIRQHRHNTPEGIFGIRYALKTLSDMGFHNIALSKASGTGVPSFEYMMSFNATTMWETFWRSERTFSRNHPMLGAVAEWLSSAVAGVELAPTTLGGEEVLFWPRIPTNARVVEYASATQGTKRGDASIAWKFLELPDDKSQRDSAVVKVHMRVHVPPASTAVLRLPSYGSGLRYGGLSMKYAKELPDLVTAKSDADEVCAKRRKDGKGFDYNWEYNREKNEWFKFPNAKAIGTPCESYLFEAAIEKTEWSPFEPSSSERSWEGGKALEIALKPGLYDVILDEWRFEAEIEDVPGYTEYKGEMGPFCVDPETFTWDVDDATHMI